MTHLHPYAVRVYEQLTARGMARPLPRDYGLRVVSESLYLAEQLRAREQSTKEQS